MSLLSSNIIVSNIEFTSSIRIALKKNCKIEKKIFVE